MKTNIKRIIAITMCLALMVASFISTSAETDVVATVATVDGPFSAGDEIAIPITISEWANAYATINISMPEYDESLLEFDGFDSSSTGFYGSLSSSGSLGFALVANPSSNREANKLLSGEVCVMYFIAKADINVSTPVSVVVVANGYTNGSSDGWLACHDLTVENVSGGILGEDPACSHAGGEATCCTKAKCEACGEEYGYYDPANHTGGTEIRNASATYTGDTYCLGCNTKISDGQTISGTVGYAIVSSASVVNGETFTVAVSMGENTALACFEAILVYEATELELVDMASGNSFKGTTIVNPSNGMAAGINSDNVTSGTFFTATFKALVPYGETTVNVVFDSTGTAMDDQTRVTMIVTPGVITIECNHEGGTATCCEKAVCNICGEEYGSFNPYNHVGETKVYDYIDADCGNDGYTGDTYCLNCGETIAYGHTIPATGNHTGGTATCCAKATCSVCGQKYGAFNANNHTGGTEIRNASATYTGDTYCLGCNTKIAEGESISKEFGYATVSGGTVISGDTITVTVSIGENTSLGSYRAILDFDESKLELVDIFAGSFCAIVNKDEKLANGFSINDITSGTLFTATFKTLVPYGETCVNAIFEVASKADTTPLNMIVISENIVIECAHEGGTATCCARAICDICGEEYGDFDIEHHAGGTEVRNASVVYTGDVWCLGCNTMIEKGETIKYYGDADGDGVATVIDAMLLAQYDARFNVTLDLSVLDVNNDGSVNIIDAMLIAQYSAKIITKFPVEQ